MLKTHHVNLVSDHDWDEFITATYKKSYCFQQQAGCRDRCTYEFSLPLECEPGGYELDLEDVPATLKTFAMQTTFAKWLERSEKEPLSSDTSQSKSALELWWQRHFYPAPEVIADNLYKRGLLPAGDYVIEIDW